MMQKAKLDQFTLDIEFLLISVIQGVALAALASSAAAPIGNLHFEYWLYIFSSFILILNFWSQAIIHAISFIDWPLDLTHNFLYFFASFIEVMAFSYMTDPLKWFGFLSVFFIIGSVLYIVDLGLMKKRKNNGHDSTHRTKLYEHIIKREQFELRFYIPLAILFHVISFALIFYFPHIFIENKFHLILVTIQTLFGIYFLLDSMRNFKLRIKRMNEATRR